MYFKYPDCFRRPTYTTDAFVLKSDDQQRTESQHCAPVVDVRPIAAGDGGKGRFQSGSDHSSFSACVIGSRWRNYFLDRIRNA